MEEINEINQVSLEWGVIANLAMRIGDLENDMPWPKLIDMISDAYDEAEKEKDPVRLFFDWHQFFWRLYYRVKNMDKPKPFNIITKEERGGDEYFRIENFDYRMFIWARRKGFTDEMDNDRFYVLRDKLSPGELKSFERKIKNNH